jgi:hypothetical protein
MIGETIPAPSHAIEKAEAARAAAEFRAAAVDSNTFLLEQDADGTREYLHYDEQEQTFSIRRVADVSGVLDWCKGRFNEGLANRHCEFRHVASFPPEVLAIWARENGIDPRYVTQALGKDRDLTKRLLNNRDLSGFRTLAGRV